jgi:hypothetical protein
MSDPALNNSDKFLKFSSLEKEYQNTLSQYQEAYQSYSQQMNDYTSNNPAYISKQGKTWWGTKGINEGTVTTKEECVDQCKSNKECSGATYNEENKYCWIRGGDGSLGIAENNNYYAIIPELKASIIQLQLINTKLIILNSDLRDAMKELEPYQAEQSANAENASIQLKQYYAKLLKEKAQMTMLLNEYDDMNKENTNQSLYLTEQNNWLFFWKITLIVSVIILFKMLFGSKIQMPVSRRIWIFIFVMLFALTFGIHTPSGFLVWGIVLLVVILMLANFIPGPSIFNSDFKKGMAENPIAKILSNNLNPEKIIKDITPSTAAPPAPAIKPTTLTSSPPPPAIVNNTLNAIKNAV